MHGYSPSQVGFVPHGASWQAMHTSSVRSPETSTSAAQSVDPTIASHASGPVVSDGSVESVVVLASVATVVPPVSGSVVVPGALVEAPVVGVAVVSPTLVEPSDEPPEPGPHADARSMHPMKNKQDK